MKRLRLISIGVLIVAIVVSIAFVNQRRERRAIDATVFAEMRKNPWDLNGDLLWGYFFTNLSKSWLEFAALTLEIVGYKTVGIFRDENKDFWWLHVEKIERHTLDSMASRNVRLSWFGRVFGGSIYDGWDVGQVGVPIPANQPPQRNAGSRPSSGDSPASETSSSLGPRG